MTITMDDTQITTLDQVQAVLESPAGLAFNRAGRTEIYAWIDSVLKRFDYFKLRRKAKGQVKAYLQRLSGLSRAQMTRLVTRDQLEGEIKPGYARRNRFATVYSNFDKELLAQTDNAHGRLSGPATRKILQRQYMVYGDKRFERLSRISSAHIYNLRSSRTYRERAQTVAKTQSTGVSIGLRRKPQPQGQPGYIRVDTVHQGDLNGEKGVYHINMVDAVLQWEIVASAETISEIHLEPVVEIALGMFPFVIVNFHSDNGSEYINAIIAKLLNKLLIVQTKSRSNRTNDNALVEGKNGSVIRKHMGHWHIEQRHAPLINQFYQEHFNPYLNFHRPCGFATVTVDEKGRRTKKYKTYQTPYERLKSLKDVETSLRPGVTIKALDAIAAKQTDNEAAALMQAARNRLFKKFDAEQLHDNGRWNEQPPRRSGGTR
jgi:transposase InsO family protein